MKTRNEKTPTGWLLAASLIAFVAVAVGGRWVLSRGFAALFDFWNINAENAHRAPAWARFIYAWHGSVVTVILSAATLALTVGLRKLWRLKRDGSRFTAKKFILPTMVGISAALFVALISLLPDSSRLAWPLSAPRFSASVVPLCAVNLFATLAGEAFTKRVLYDGVRGRWGDIWAAVVASLAFLVANVAWPINVVSALNVLLVGALCYVVYARFGLWASVGLRWGWGVGVAFLLGFGGGNAAIYRLYGVSETLLTGGDAGPMAGLWATLLICAGIAYLVLPRQVRSIRGNTDTTRASKRYNFKHM